MNTGLYAKLSSVFRVDEIINDRDKATKDGLQLEPMQANADSEAYFS
jgi:hypothetical protein